MSTLVPVVGVLSLLAIGPAAAWLLETWYREREGGQRKDV